MREPEVPVLIVGGGPAGLSASLLLSRHGIGSLLVERHPGTSVHPKARGLNVRTLELFRVWGIESAIRAAASDLARAVDVVWAPTLLAAESRRAPYGGAAERQHADSPAESAGCAQDKLEPVLLEAARSYQLGELEFGHELAAIDQDEHGALATVVDCTRGVARQVRAAWVIAADGAQSPVRSMLGISMTGPGALAHRMGIYFRADLRQVGRDRPALLYMLSPPEGPGVMAAVNLADLWLYMAPFHPDQDEQAEDFTAERCVRLVRSAVGDPGLDVEVLSALPWAAAAAVAERFRQGRVFLAGDSAHLIPPTGGQALNVGIQDVHNLVWKLAGAVAGWAGPGLLDTYELERRPFAAAVMADASRNVAAFGARPEQFSNRGRVLGVCYDSPAVAPDGTGPPAVDNPVIDYLPTARPGCRAPHVWLRRGGRVISAIDLYDTSFALLAGTNGQGWKAAGEQSAQQLGVPLHCYLVGPGGDLADEPGHWPDLYGAGPDGAVLVRPDGHVAWRAATASINPSAELSSVLRRILCLSSARLPPLHRPSSLGEPARAAARPGDQDMNADGRVPEQNRLST